MIFISKLSKREKTIFYVAVVLVGLALLNHFFLKPTLARLDQIEAETAVFQQDLKSDKMILDRKDSIIAEYNKRSYYLKASSDFKKNVDHLAMASRLQVDKISPIDLKEGDEVFKGVSVNLVGDLESVISFLHALSTSDMIVSIHTLNMRREGAREDSPLMCDMKIARLVIR
ncbi:MAG: hypothetical protein KAS70_04010 [Planctomycetes bacterium]|nr:hypothetical protein [Planctomycetota bacterium]